MKVGAWTSENGIVLNGFSEENGILYYKGSPIGSSASEESVSSSGLPAASDVQTRDYGTPYVVQQGALPNDRYCKFLLQGSITDSSRGNKTPIPVETLQSGTDYKLPVIDSGCPANGNTQRENMKKLLMDLEYHNKGLRHRIFGAMQKAGLDGYTETRMRIYSDPKNEE